MDGKLKEPMFEEINGIDVVQPDVRFPIGQYITLGPKVGILFPSVPFNKRGRAMRNALNDLQKLLFGMLNATDEEMDNLLNKSAEELNIVWEQIEDAAMAFFKAALEINYNAETAEWIMETIMIDMKSTQKMLLVARGEEADADIFRGK